MSRAAGLGFVVLTFAASVVLGNAPEPDDPALEVANYFDDEHARAVASFHLEGLALACFLAFVSAFRGAALAAGLLFAACLAQSAVILGALGYRATDDEFVAESLFDLARFSLTFAAFPAAVLVIAATPRRFRLGGLVVAGLLLVSGATFAGSGVFSPGGFVSDLAYGLFLLWVVATSFRIPHPG